MSGPVTIHVPENRLAKLLRTPGGKPVAEAMADAKQGLQSLQGDCMADLDKTLAAAEAIAAQAKGQFDPKVAADLYATVSATIGVPTACDLEAVDTALISLSDLLDYLTEKAMWDTNAVAVHLRAVKLLLRTAADKDGAGTQAILEGLRQVSQRFARPDGSTAG
jgi:hypothetical protein